MNKDYELLLAVTKKSVDALIKILDKAQSHIKEKGIEDAVLLNASLYPDMMNFTKQIQIASDNARKNLARLAGEEPVAMEDNETTIQELKERVVKTREVINSFEVSDFADADTREIRLPWFNGTHMFGKDFVCQFAISNLLFHTVTAYDVLRAQGVNVGKTDFIGEMFMHPDASSNE